MNLPTLPSGINQILLVICFYVLFQLLNDSRNAYKELKIANDEYNMNVDSLKEDSTESQMLFKDAYEYEKELADKSDKMSTVEFLNARREVDSITQVQYKRINQQANLEIRLTNYRKAIEDAEENVEFYSYTNPTLAIRYLLLSVCIVYLFWKMEKEESENRKFLKLQRYKERTYEYCQSCARIFSPILSHGKEKNGNINSGFCNDCYDDGEFKNPKLTAEEVIASIQSLNQKDNHVSKKVMKLIRWNKNPYLDF